MMKQVSGRDLDKYLASTRFIDSDSASVIVFCHQVIGCEKTEKGKAIRLYMAVRDGIRYSPYHISFLPERFKASWVLGKKVGFCVQKAILLAALARAAGIPSRLGFADVRNHLMSDRLAELMKTEVFVFHGYTELFLNHKWVKTTPAFDLSVCERQGVKPLGFDGETDSVFQPFDSSGNRHIEYLTDHGCFDDFPLMKMIRAFKRAYPHLFQRDAPGWPVADEEV